MSKNLKASLLKAQIEFPPITRNQSGYHKAGYADLYHILELVRPILAKNDLCVNWETDEKDSSLIATILEHTETKERSVSISKLRPGKDDKDWGGSCTYQKRYGLIAVLGIAVSGDREDSDGAKIITPDQLRLLQETIKAHTQAKMVFPALLKHGGISKLEELYQHEFEGAIEFIAGWGR